MLLAWTVLTNHQKIGRIRSDDRSGLLPRAVWVRSRPENRTRSHRHHRNTTARRRAKTHYAISHYGCCGNEPRRMAQCSPLCLPIIQAFDALTPSGKSELRIIDGQQIVDRNGCGAWHMAWQDVMRSMKGADAARSLTDVSAINGNPHKQPCS